MIIERTKKNTIHIVTVSGMITLGESSRKFSEFLDRIVSEKPQGVVIDLEKIDYVDSTGIGELVGYLSTFKDKKIPMVLVNPKERVKKLLDITGLNTVFPILESVDGAVEWCERGDSNPHSLSTTRT